MGPSGGLGWTMKEHRYPLNGRLGGPHWLAARFGEDNFLPLPGFEDDIFQPRRVITIPTRFVRIHLTLKASFPWPKPFTSELSRIY